MTTLRSIIFLFYKNIIDTDLSIIEANGQFHRERRVFSDPVQTQ